MIEDITVGSANVEVSDALRAHVRDAIHNVARKYLDHLVRAGAHFSQEGVAYRCSIHVQVGSLPLMAAEASADEARIAFALALDKIAAQMARTKRAKRDEKVTRTDKDAVLRASVHPPSD